MNRRMLRLNLWQTYRIAKGMASGRLGTIDSRLALKDMNRRTLRLKLWQTYRIAKGMACGLRTIPNHSFVQRFYFPNLRFFE
jgi:hypothetical protein